MVANRLTKNSFYLYEVLHLVRDANRNYDTVRPFRVQEFIKMYKDTKARAAVYWNAAWALAYPL